MEYFYKLEYTWIHLPSGKQGTDTGYFANREVFTAQMERWNREGGTTWKYVESHNNGFWNNTELFSRKNRIFIDNVPDGNTAWYGLYGHSGITKIKTLEEVRAELDKVMC